MMKFVAKEDELTCVAELSGCFGVYLDTDSLIELATGAVLRRQRFVDALLRGGDLLFSFTNAVEIAGPQGTTATAIRSFLDSVRSHWIPLELDPWKVVRREATGHFRPSRSFRIFHGGVLSRAHL
jgi:hypothetical protein